MKFSIELLEWSRKFSDFGVSKDSNWEDSRLKKKIRKLFFIKFKNKFALTAFRPLKPH